MTLETCKRLYKHFIEKGMQKEADDMLKNRPEAKENVPETKSKEKK